MAATRFKHYAIICMAALFSISTENVNISNYFIPNQDVCLSGNHAFDHFYVPKGITVWLENDVYIKSQTDIIIEGAIICLPEKSKNYKSSIDVTLNCKSKIIISGKIKAGNGLDASFPDVSGQKGGSIYLTAQQIFIDNELIPGNGGNGRRNTKGGIGGNIVLKSNEIALNHDLIAGDGGNGGDNADGGNGGNILLIGKIKPFDSDRVVIGGNGGDGGKGNPGINGGNGGDGGNVCIFANGDPGTDGDLGTIGNPTFGSTGSDGSNCQNGSSGGNAASTQGGDGGDGGDGGHATQPDGDGGNGGNGGKGGTGYSGTGGNGGVCYTGAGGNGGDGGNGGKGTGGAGGDGGNGGNGTGSGDGGDGGRGGNGGDGYGGSGGNGGNGGDGLTAGGSGGSGGVGIAGSGTSGGKGGSGGSGVIAGTDGANGDSGKGKPGYDGTPGSNGSLPIELVSFSVKEKDGKIIFKWTTASEINNFRFEIQQSDSLTDWTTIAFVEGNKTTNVQHNYSYTIPYNEIGLRYFRLKQIDFDGSFNYSNIIFINLLKQNNICKVYPNPTNGILKFDMNYDEIKSGLCQVFNYHGETVYSMNILPDNQPDFPFIVDLRSLHKGNYILLLRINDEFVIEKIKIN